MRHHPEPTPRGLSGRPSTPAAQRDLYRAQGWWGDAGLLAWWRLAAAASPDALAVVDRSGHRYTYAEADHASSRLAGWMRARGVRPGDGVGVQLPNWSEFWIVFVAALKAGAVVVPLAPNLRRCELEQAIVACLAAAAGDAGPLPLHRSLRARGRARPAGVRPPAGADRRRAAGHLWRRQASVAARRGAPLRPAAPARVGGRRR
ncbi:MAG: AMP-binding protein [Propioniciclava sp.]|uniref:AMP-binding protein n=1 Tax=Propioniciclava sp. TaxID=2038686 RepID=UPI0039E26465